MASSFRVQVTGLAFGFNSASLVLKQVPICIEKPKTNIFDKSIKFLHWFFLVVVDGFGSFKGQVDSPEMPEITEMTGNFTKVTKYLTKLKDTLINYV